MMNKSLLKTYIYYTLLLAVTIFLSTYEKLSFVWIWGVLRFAYLLYLTFKYIQSIGILSSRVNVLSGPPGCGKTFLMTVLAVRAIKTYNFKVMVARLLYEQHGEVVKYRSKLYKKRKVSADTAKQVISLFKSSKELERDKKLPIISNITITYKNKTSYPLTMGHLLQKTRVPEGFILCIDEIGQYLSAEGYKTTPKEIKDLFRLNRHFFDGYILATEQDHNNIDISVRRVVGQNYRLEVAKHSGRAYFLELLNRINLKLRVIKALILERTYGFRKIEYNIESNTESQQNVRIINSHDAEEKTYFYVPACYVYYNDREKFSEYKAD